ncbi:hypothetical protein DL95DRAFT_96376 [Leptodontidium sp. 2 PMI_412]|nr:hypothetical protein DL95DRAFT_96376 [Leptodontidium sp. 2 PMI_412]
MKIISTIGYVVGLTMAAVDVDCMSRYQFPFNPLKTPVRFPLKLSKFCFHWPSAAPQCSMASFIHPARTRISTFESCPAPQRQISSPSYPVPHKSSGHSS